MERHDVTGAASTLPELRVSTETTEEEAMAAVRPLAGFNQCTLGVTRFSGLTPWERHPGGDELLYVLEGGVDVTVLTDDGAASATVPVGSLFVVPAGLWHRQRAPAGAALLFATAVEGSESSWAEDPREEPRQEARDGAG